MTKYAKTLQKIVDDTLRFCGDYRGAGKDGLYFKQSEVFERLNDTILKLVNDTGLLKAGASLNIVNGVRLYQLPEDCIRPIRLTIFSDSKILLHSFTLDDFDMIRMPLNQPGLPSMFYRDHSKFNQIALFPTPSINSDKSGATQLKVAGDTFGLIRRVTDDSGDYMRFSGNSALREVTGTTFYHKSGDGYVLRGIDMEGGGLVHLDYVRLPELVKDLNSYPDSDIPEYFHQYVKYGIALRLLTASQLPIHAIKKQAAQAKWDGAVSWLKSWTDIKAGNASMVSV